MNIETNNNIKSTIAQSALMHVIDPEIGLNVVDLGLIYSIRFDEEKNLVHVLMTLTTQFCPMGESITSNVEEAVRNSFPGQDVLVELTFDPPWSSERISEEGQEFLNQ